MIDRTAFFDRARTDLFGGRLSGQQVQGVTAILDLWDKSGLADLRWLAYVLATALHETGRAMVGVREGGQGKGKSYGKPIPPHGLVYYGRGLVQLTFIGNYQAATLKLRQRGFSVDLVLNPDDALRLDVACAVLIWGSVEGWFTNRKLSDYFGAAVNDPVGARRIINGTDKADVIAGYHQAFLLALNFGNTSATPSRSTPLPSAPADHAPTVPSPGPVALPATTSPSFWTRFLSIFRKAA